MNSPRIELLFTLQTRKSFCGRHAEQMTKSEVDLFKIEEGGTPFESDTHSNLNRRCSYGRERKFGARICVKLGTDWSAYCARIVDLCEAQVSSFGSIHRALPALTHKTKEAGESPPASDFPLQLDSSFQCDGTDFSQLENRRRWSIHPSKTDILTEANQRSMVDG